MVDVETKKTYFHSTHNILISFQDRVQQYEKFVAEHQEYSDSYNACIEWLNSAREKLTACSDVSGDRHAIQGRLDKIQVNIC